MKKIYSSPQVETIEIDNEISVIMMSEAPPTGPGEDEGALRHDLNPNKEEHFLA